LERHEATISKALSEVDRLAGAIVLVGTLGNEGAAQHDGEAAREILEVNFTGVVTAVTPLADALEAQGEGFLVVVSSVAGDRGRASNYVYGSAKAGLSAFAQGLRNRLHGSGVHVATVKPGFVDTKMTYGREGMFLVASPDRVARAIQRAGENRKDIVYVPWFWRPVMWLIRALPERIFKRLSL
ncbi:MAG: SDR family NAD(P)-dependent oxidoreductase, partial [Candidatus Thermoplasmatota archaeon]|nr:SDR family NAD(P)-dependent oxidoreductase [Candidatus Thermoplasmatota archaeon]